MQTPTLGLAKSRIIKRPMWCATNNLPEVSDQIFEEIMPYGKEEEKLSLFEKYTGIPTLFPDCFIASVKSYYDNGSFDWPGYFGLRQTHCQTSKIRAMTFNSTTAPTLCRTKQVAGSHFTFRGIVPEKSDFAISNFQTSTSWLSKVKMGKWCSCRLL